MLGFCVIDRILCQLAERAEFDEQRAVLGRVRIGVAHLACLEIDEAVRQPRRRVEGWEQSGSQIIGQSKETLVVRELIA